MVSPRRLAAALSSLSVLSMLVVVMSLPPVMKKRDRPLVGDSPARIRVPMVGTVSLGGVVAVANGRCGIPESSPGRPLRKACGASPRNQVRGGAEGRVRGKPPESPGIKSGAASAEGRVRGKPPESSPWARPCGRPCRGEGKSGAASAEGRVRGKPPESSPGRLCGRPCAGQAPGIKSGAASAEGRVRPPASPGRPLAEGRVKSRGGLCGRPCAGQAPGIKSGAASAEGRVRKGKRGPGIKSWGGLAEGRVRGKPPNQVRGRKAVCGASPRNQVRGGLCGRPGASPRNQVRGGLCGRPCAGQAPGIKSGAGSVVHRAQVLPPIGVGEKTCATRMGFGEEGWQPAGERAGEAATPVRGAAWWNGAPVQAIARRRRPWVQAGH